MNNTSSSISSALMAAPYQLNIWFGIFLWVTGNLGSIGNMLVFRSPTFRNLFSEAICDFFYFYFVLTTRILQKGFQVHVTTRYDVICKLRQFFSVWGNQVSFTLFSLATIDRLLSTQRANIYRQWSNRIPLAYKVCMVCALIWLLFIGHRLILYKAKNGKCAPRSEFYAYFDNYIEIALTAICPPVVMIVRAY
ncbi:unnamed protein product [Rotaria socialis]|uniref:G-protein coupled receptors family 1 profile domain-containing protein n=1 Tax=Rotaria socialis TaxID=392032 RepID=A0A817SS82_9BILA|nr:unnamed protein product [Rotaria socialis]CAF3382044.1 unnamed protein product [Rotaria socialis]CAF4507154.1 unnamed protein product [Rotaria socialis]CAF4530106.1 unnamed protein product [Rotaria socialis]